MGKRKKIFGAAALLLSLALLVLTPTSIYAQMTKKNYFPGKDYKAVVRLWHLDSFEGGKGSRADFLAARANEYEKTNTGQFILVTNHTAESASAAFASGDYPDAISFGTGFSEHIREVQPFTGYDFDAGKFSGKTYAFPWCYGAYGVFSVNKQIDLNNLKGKIAINSPGGVAAAALSGLVIEKYETEEPVSAYVGLLNGKYDYLIGTQRDAARFNAREVQVNFEPLGGFSDLYQYISILTKNEVKSTIVRKFTSYLLNENSQKKVASLYMLSFISKVYNEENTLMQKFEMKAPNLTIPAFIGDTQKLEFYNIAQNAIKGNADALKKLKNFAVNI